jgi:hypothetical protein
MRWAAGCLHLAFAYMYIYNTYIYIYIPTLESAPSSPPLLKLGVRNINIGVCNIDIIHPSPQKPQSTPTTHVALQQ